MSSDDTIDRNLLEHSGWTRALAARLVADPHVADELSQDTLVMALERPPQRHGDLRRWLGTVMGNLLRQGRRREVRLRERERHGARMEAQPSVLDTLERAAVHRELVDALLQIDEPFRTTLVLRFFDGLPPREVARRLGVPVNTVRSRVQRGLAQMRTRLDRGHHGDRRAWVGALMPVVREGGAGGGLSLGIALMNLKTKLVVAVAAVLAGVLWTVWPSPTGAAEQLPSGELGVEPILVAGAETGASQSGGDEALQRVAVQPATPIVPDESSLVAMAGTVIGVDAAPLAGVGVMLRALVGVREPLRAVSDVDGRFAISVPPESAAILVDEPGFVTVFSGTFRPDGKIEPVVVASRARALRAWVLDEEGLPLRGARSQVHIPESFATRFTQVLETTKERPVYGISDDAGRVSMEQAPVFDGAELLTSLPGYVTDRRPMAEAGDELRIVLRRDVVTGSVLQGVVLDPDGAAAAGAYVALDELTSQTEDDGSFRFDLSEAPDARELRAVFPGSLPVELARLDHQEWPEFVTLRLGQPAEVISGRVVDANGDSQAGVVVWTADPTLFGTVGFLPAQVENLLAGSKTLEELEAYVDSQPAGFDRNAFLDRTPTAFWTYVETDARGRFRLEGLLPRTYRLAVLRRETLEMMETGPIGAGSRDVEIEFGRQDVYENVAGRVISREGEPLAGVSVSYSRGVFRVRKPDDPPGRYQAVRDMAIDPVRTDPDGRFRLDAVPVGLELLFHGDAVIATYQPLADRTDLGNLEVVVPSRVHLRVELAVPDRADSFAILDADDREVGLQLIRVGRRQVMMRGALEDGRSQILATGDGSFTLVLYRGDVEVERHPVYLRPGDPNVLRY